MKIMLVDDSATMRRIQRNQLNNMGVTEIIEATDGQDALEKLYSGVVVDKILLDWNMPNMDGITFLHKVRQDERFKNIKIIMCTSESEKSRVIDALKAGANNYIVKPFTPEALKEKLGL